MKRILLPILVMVCVLVVGSVWLTGCETTAPKPFPPPASESSPTPTEQPSAPATKSQEPAEVKTPQYSPANINLFSSVQEGEIIRFFFLLEDASGGIVSADGHVKIEIFDDLNNSLYSEEFDVRASEFVDYTFKLTGNI